MSRGIAVIAGIGPGLGLSLAKRFSKDYDLALLGRSNKNLDPVVAHVNENGGHAIGYPTDVASEKDMTDTFEKISKDFQNKCLVVGIYNVGGAFKRGSFLDTSLKDFLNAQKSNTTGAFLFSQHVLRNMLAEKLVSSSSLAPTILFTGATASVKGGPSSSSFAVGKFGVRALSQSLAREFQPKGIHVAHAIIDGVIGTSPEDNRIRADSIAEAYYQLHAQDRSCWTQEIDLRPWVEKF